MLVVRDQLERLGRIDPDSLDLPLAAEAIDSSGAQVANPDAARR